MLGMSSFLRRAWVITLSRYSLRGRILGLNDGSKESIFLIFWRS
jgi:hypothetical protein